MAAIVETLQDVCLLAERMPGISILGSDVSTSEARIRVLSSGAEAIGILQWLASSANATIDPCLAPPADTEIEQVIVARVLPRDGLALGELQILGIHIVWHLHKIGAMNGPDANVLLHKWGATPVGA
ncbi:hypothetical protein J5837_09230, partial [Pseudoxanthomonas helianthi]